MKSVRIAGGLGFYGDSWRPIRASIERGNVQYVASDHLAVLRDRHIDGGPSLSVDELDHLRHRVGIFAAVLLRFEAEAGAVHMRFLRTLVGRHLRKSMGELHGRAACKRARMGPAPILCRRTEVRKS